MKYLLSIISFLFINSCIWAQPTIYPAPQNKGYILLTHATIHVGNGDIIKDGSILINGAKIEKVGGNITAPEGAKEYDVQGKEVYPGLINPISNLGTKEVGSGVPGTDDYRELGDLNPSVRSIVAYNTDSRVINVLRTNGVLLANTIPQSAGGSGQILSGTSSVVQLDAWTWADAAYQMDGQMHLNIPALYSRWRRSSDKSIQKEALSRIEKVKSFFREAKSYLEEKEHAHTNLKFEATRNLFNHTQKLFVHADDVKQMLIAIDFKKEFSFDVAIVGGIDSWKIAPVLKENNIPVILSKMHALPETIDDDIDQPFKTPYQLQQAGVLFAIADHESVTRGRNLMYNAGTAAAYGLTKEQALSAITLNPAKILGIGDRTGSIEAGKDANIIVSKGDILDMQHSIVTLAFIQGRKINLANKQTQLADKYLYRYGLK